MKKLVFEHLFKVEVKVLFITNDNVNADSDEDMDPDTNEDDLGNVSRGGGLEQSIRNLFNVINSHIAQHG